MKKKILIAVGALLLVAGGAGAAQLATTQTIPVTITVPYTVAGQSGEVVVSKDVIVPVETVTVTQTVTVTDTTPTPPPPSDTTPPSAPVLSAGTPTQTSVTLNWKQGVDNVGVDHYEVYRGTSSDATAQTKVTDTKNLSYTLTGLTCATNYSMAVVVVDAAGNKSKLADAVWYPLATTACDQSPPPPSSSEKLKWAPPELSNPTTINVTSSNRFLDLTAGRDYIIKMPSTPLGQNPNTDLPALWVRGGRNVVIIGGEIVINQLSKAGESNYHQRGLMVGGQSGTIHIEGMWIHGSGMGQAITIENSRGNSNIVQVQNSRLETMHPIWHTADGFPNEIHTDTIQSWNGPTVLRLYQDTFISTGNVLQMQPRQYSQHPLGTWDYRRVNFVNTTPDGYALWKQTAVWAEYHEDLWLQTDPRHPWASQHSAWAGNSTCWACWNPGGSWPITGEAFQIGLRPTDFVPSSAAGVNYVSPGYQ